MLSSGPSLISLLDKENATSTRRTHQKTFGDSSRAQQQKPRVALGDISSDRNRKANQANKIQIKHSLKESSLQVPPSSSLPKRKSALKKKKKPVEEPEAPELFFNPQYEAPIPVPSELNFDVEKIRHPLCPLPSAFARSPMGSLLDDIESEMVQAPVPDYSHLFEDDFSKEFKGEEEESFQIPELEDEICITLEEEEEVEEDEEDVN